MDKDELIRYLERKLKIRTLHQFEIAQEPITTFEREFAIQALDMMRRQPAMQVYLDVDGNEIIQ